ncbi:hypothetical protein ACIG63_27470 [Streptomyces antimycoticus]|uniref:hypothetical protein n=1 Tax=Streptomyces antimycoticus TaxID=68175 RepID=UPI0037D09E9A
MADQSIALISAASALAGVALTGGFTLLKGRQERTDKQADRDEQRRVMHRAARRDVYAELLTAYHEVDRNFREVAKTRPPADPTVPIPSGSDVAYQAEASINALRQAAAAVALEGPAEAGAAADKLCEACFSLLIAFAGLDVEHAGSSEPLWSYDSTERDEAQTEVSRACWAFIEQARATLGGDAPGFG